MLQHFTDTDFQKQVMDQAGLVIVDFFATWCGPCKMIAPIMEDMSVKYEGKARIGKMDVDESHDVPGKFGIMSIPTIIFFKGGQEVDRIVGFQSKEALEEKIIAHV